MLGQADEIMVDKENTTIIEGKGKTEAVKGRIDQIKKQIENTDFRLRQARSCRSGLRSSPAVSR